MFYKMMPLYKTSLPSSLNMYRNLVQQVGRPVTQLEGLPATLPERQFYYILGIIVPKSLPLAKGSQVPTACCMCPLKIKIIEQIFTVNKFKDAIENKGEPRPQCLELNEIVRSIDDIQISVRYSNARHPSLFACLRNL